MSSETRGRKSPPPDLRQAQGGFSEGAAELNRAGKVPINCTPRQALVNDLFTTVSTMTKILPGFFPSEHTRPFALLPVWMYKHSAHFAVTLMESFTVGTFFSVSQP